MRLKILALLFLFCSCLSTARAEILQGINYVASLGDVKAVYPNATFTIETPAWLQPSQAFYTISGSGLSGSIKVLFSDSRPDARQRLWDNKTNPDFDKSGFWKGLAGEQDNDALNVLWVRWVPLTPIPLDRYKQRYGNPTCSLNDVMQPICTWQSVALEASMTDDSKMVTFVTTVFTKAERQRGWLIKFGYVPDNLK